MKHPIYAINNTIQQKIIEDIGGIIIPSSGVYDLAGKHDLLTISKSVILREFVTSGDISISVDGIISLSISEGLKHLNLITEYDLETTVVVEPDIYAIAAAMALALGD